jgi:4-carboxymuconolactone decarboxylase
LQKAHIREGKKNGLSDEQIDALVAGNDPTLADPHENAVYAFASSQIAGKTLSDAEFAEVEKVLGRNGIAEVLVMIGYYTSVSLAMRVHEVPYQPPPA